MEKTDFLSPYIRVAMDSIISPPWILHERVIFDYELLYIKSGRVLITMEDAKYEGRPGDVFLFKPMQRHSIRLIGNECFHQPHLHFDLFCGPDSEKVKVSFKPPEDMNLEEMQLFRPDDTAPGCPMELPGKLKISNVQYFEDILFEIIHEHSSRNPFSGITVKSLFLKLWAYILKENYYANNPAVCSRIEQMIKIRDYLGSNMRDDLSLDDLANRFHISKYHLTRLFRQAFGTTPIHYCRMIRIEKAKELIQYSSQSLTQISGTLGFKNLSAFTRAFINAEGVPPSFYRAPF